MDHPRSRGVYGWSHSRRGSNPRIIPARAGFTYKPSQLRYIDADHPRSRGVYDEAIPDSYDGCGSSPLARGLRVWKIGPKNSEGIIPARAGFTIACRVRHPARPDHPRSRGVYNWDPAPVVCENGSSPLARGLPRMAPRCFETSGIIPARAGFTTQEHARQPSAWDHPRSRGVYLEEVEGVGDDARIIPARAGFTAGVRSRAAEAWDHPRSRGVYGTPSSGSSVGPGSSPLARGLPG